VAAPGQGRDYIGGDLAGTVVVGCQVAVDCGHSARRLRIGITNQVTRA
jgi:hypothetical protein